MRIPLAREGLPFIAAAALPAAALLAAAVLLGGTLWWTLGILFGLLALAIAGFFRDPEREGPRGLDLVLSPADGRVIEVASVEEPSFLQGNALKISIFLSLFDVHVNRYPVSGIVRHRTYDSGRFEPAWRKTASASNERASTGIQSDPHAVLVRQIAGLAARRIVNYAQVGQQVEQGERMGLIRFGSRLDLYLPSTATASVVVGQRAAGGVTVLARLTSRDRGES